MRERQDYPISAGREYTPASGAEEGREVPATVAILMGSASDYGVMKPAEEVLDALGIAHDVRIISAHRTPDRLVRYLESAEENGVEVIICGAGGAAHLAGVAAAHTVLPVLGVPIESSPLKGLDALLATVQMPGP
jgi:5-(carboxyamino)imidazole ribonucleotide mutase